jgi:hypothetical protein
LDEPNNKQQQTAESQQANESAAGLGRTAEDEVSELIDLMTMKEADTLSEQMKELEKLEMEKRQRQQGAYATVGGGIGAPPQSAHASGVLGTASAAAASLFSAKFPFVKNSTSSTTGGAKSSNLEDLLGLEVDTLAKPTSSGNMQLFSDLLTNASDEFEREWQSAFSSTPASQLPSTSAASGSGAPLSPTLSAAGDEFGFFVSAQDMMPAKQPGATADSITDLTSLFPSRLLLDNASNSSKSAEDQQPTKPSTSDAATAKPNKASIQHSRLCFFSSSLFLSLSI